MSVQLTQEQAAQKTREIGAKYEKELENVGQKHALKEFKDYLVITIDDDIIFPKTMISFSSIS